MIERIKRLVGIRDTEQDEVIEDIVELVSAHILSYIGSTTLPRPLNFIVVELSVRRYQRLGSEGMMSEETEGHRISFYDLDKEMDPYLDILDEYRDENGKGRGGEVLFL